MVFAGRAKILFAFAPKENYVTISYIYAYLLKSLYLNIFFLFYPLSLLNV